MTPTTKTKLREYCKENGYTEATYLAIQEDILILVQVLEEITLENRKKRKLKKAA